MPLKETAYKFPLQKRDNSISATVLVPFIKVANYWQSGSGIFHKSLFLQWQWLNMRTWQWLSCQVLWETLLSSWTWRVVGVIHIIQHFLFRHLTANDLSPVLMSHKTHNAHLYATMPSLQIRMIEPGRHMAKNKMVDMWKTTFYVIGPWACTWNAINNSTFSTTEVNLKVR
jgi:hypothetical protein